MAATAITPRRIMRAKSMQLRFTATADASFSIPAGYAMSEMYLDETAGNAITGGIHLGTTDTGNDIINALAVGASAIKHVPEASLLLRWFSRTVAQTVYLTAVTAWNSASLNVCIILNKVVG